MQTSSRRLTFAVGTSLLTASLSVGAVGCKKATVNEGPEPPHVNEGPAPDPEPTVNPVEEGEPDAPEMVNTVPDE